MYFIIIISFLCHLFLCAGETGLLLGEILPVLDKKLYKGESKLENLKIVRDVIKPGDKYFNFGDLLYQDKDYFVYFKDRLGETFR